MPFAQLTPTRDSMSEPLDAPRHREVAVFGHSTPGQTRTPNEGNGTPKRDIFLGRIADRVEQQKEQHNTSSTSQTPSAPRHPEIFYMLHVGKRDEVVQCFAITVQLRPTRDSTSEPGYRCLKVGVRRNTETYLVHPGANQNAK